MSHSTVILDTSVVIAALFRPGSDSARVLEEVRSGKVRLLWSPATRQETETLVRRIPPIEWGAVEALYSEDGRRDPAGGQSFPSIPDSEDHKFAALALATGAVLVSLDQHLLQVDPLEGVKAVTPTGFLQRLEPRS